MLGGGVSILRDACVWGSPLHHEHLFTQGSDLPVAIFHVSRQRCSLLEYISIVVKIPAENVNSLIGGRDWMYRGLEKIPNLN